MGCCCPAREAPALRFGGVVLACVVFSCSSFPFLLYLLNSFNSIDRYRLHSLKNAALFFLSCLFDVFSATPERVGARRGVPRRLGVSVDAGHQRHQAVHQRRARREAHQRRLAHCEPPSVRRRFRIAVNVNFDFYN